MSQRHRREGGQDGDRRPSQGNERGTERPSHQESSGQEASEERAGEPTTTTRTEDIDRQEGLRPDHEVREADEVPEERQALIEFIEELYDDDSLAPARREELLREGCDVRILDIERARIDDEEEE